MRRARLSRARFIRRVIFLKNEIVLFTDGDINIEVELSPELETVWLTQKQMGELFEVKQATLSEHINNIISSGELDETSIGFSDKSSGGRKPKIYNLDMILSVGYRVNSKRGIAFRSIGCDDAYDCRFKTRRKRYNGESCNEFFDNVVSS